jgi:hypothetical protein
MGYFELLKTEEKYINDMLYIIHSIIKPLQNQASSSSPPPPSVLPLAVQSIFINLEQLVGVNQIFLNDLKKIPIRTSFPSFTTNSIKPKDFQKEMEIIWSNVSSIIITTWPDFRTYKTYSVGHGSRKV